MTSIIQLASRKVPLVVKIFVLMSLLISCSSKPQEIAPTPTKELTQKEKSEEIISNYFDLIINGSKGNEYFCSSNILGDFFSPRNFKILSSKIDSNEQNNRVLVRVDSSNRSGSPITKTWEFVVRLKDHSPYNKLTKYNMCIDGFSDSEKQPEMTYEQDKLIKDLEKSLGR